VALVVQLENVTLRYGEGPEILKHVSLGLAPGDFRFLSGKSGAGKSTLLRLLFLMLKPTSGAAHVFGQNVKNLTQKDVALLRRKLGVVFQDFRLLPHMSVFDNVALPLRAAGLRREAYAGDVNDLLDWVGLKGRAKEVPQMLSGGEMQRVAIARAVVAKPQLILADEPTGNVDAVMARRLMHLFQELNKLGATVLIATHDEHLMAGAKGRILRLQDHTVVAQ
jgi:cell division transport system ATP-binding protein